MTRSKRALKDISFYSASIMVTQVVTMAAAILTRRFLGPTQMGIWAFLQVLLTYAEYSALGTTAALALEVPLYNGRGDRERAARIMDAAFSFAMITVLAVAGGTVAYAFFMRAMLREELFYGFLMAAGFVVLQRFNGLAITIVRAEKQFIIAGKQMLYSSIINALLIALLSYRYRLYGFLMAMALSLAFNVAYLVWRARLRVRFSTDWAQMVALVRYGVPLMAVGLLRTVYETMDRLFITRFLGFEALGLYSIAMMAANYLNGVPNSVGVVTVSHLQETYGENKDADSLRRYLDKVDAGYGILMVYLVGASWFLLPWMVRLALPEYVNGLTALRWVVLGAYFAALAQGYSQLIYVIRKHQAFFVLLPLSCAAAAGACAFAVWTGRGVNGIAAAAAFSGFSYFTLHFFYASLQVEAVSASLRRYAGVTGLFVLAAVSLYAIDRWVVWGGSLLNPWLQTIVFALLWSPLILRLEKEFGLRAMWRRTR